jgi:NAD(P)-dependent dehydrogenase (short-subunit alcohol dehydrogenase family)
MRITTPFGLETTAAEVMEGIDLTGKNAIVTGGASGIGVETARALAEAGAAVTLAVRNLGDGERVAAAIDGDVRVRFLDLADRHSIAGFVGEWDESLHILVNNAGVMAIRERQLSPDGWEMQFATNHMGHFELALGLHGALAAAGSARVVAVSSSAHLQSPVLFDDINFDFIAYSPFLAYGQSKSANVLFAVAADQRWAGDGIRVNAVAPGAMITPRIPERSADEEREMMTTVPMHRRGTTDDIGKAVLFFLSDLSTYVSGQTLAVDGGFTAVGPIDYTANLPLVDVSGPGGTIGVD